MKTLNNTEIEDNTRRWKDHGSEDSPLWKWLFYPKQLIVSIESPLALLSVMFTEASLYMGL